MSHRMALGWRLTKIDDPVQLIPSPRL